MSAVSPSLEPNQTGPKKLGWVGPISASLLAGVGQAFVSFDLNWWGLMLLLACGALGSGLLRVPQNARTWDPPPTSSQATLKQTIGIARVLVYVSLVALPGIVFLTSEPIRKMFPPQIEDYISKYAPDSIKIESMFVFLPRERENVQDRPFYFAKLGSKPRASGTNGVGGVERKSSEGAGIKGELYVVQTDMIIKNIFDRELLPKIYLVLTCLVAVVAIFSGAIWCMEVVGGAMWEQRAR